MSSEILSGFVVGGLAISDFVSVDDTENHNLCFFSILETRVLFCDSSLLMGLSENTIA